MPLKCFTREDNKGEKYVTCTNMNVNKAKVKAKVKKMNTPKTSTTMSSSATKPKMKAKVKKPTTQSPRDQDDEATKVAKMKELSSKFKKNPHPPSSIESVVFQKNDPARHAYAKYVGNGYDKNVRVAQTADYVLKSGTFKAFKLDGTHVYGIRLLSSQKAQGAVPGQTIQMSKQKTFKPDWIYWNGKKWTKANDKKITNIKSV